MPFLSAHIQQLRLVLKTKLMPFALVCAGLVLLAGCGKRPSQVEPPEGAKEVVFPEVYPDVSTDPKP